MLCILLGYAGTLGSVQWLILAFVRVFPWRKYSFNLGDWVQQCDKKDHCLAKNHCKYNMENEEGFDIGRDLPVFLASVLDKTEYFCQNDEGEGVAEAHAEVIDQSIRMLKSIRDCRDIGTSDKEELELLAEAFAHVLSSLNHHIAIKPVTPETVAEYRFASKKEEKETPG